MLVRVRVHIDRRLSYKRRLERAYYDFLIHLSDIAWQLVEGGRYLEWYINIIKLWDYEDL